MSALGGKRTIALNVETGWNAGLMRLLGRSVSNEHQMIA